MRRNFQAQKKDELRKEKEKKMQYDMKGEGIFLYKNNTKGDLFLPKAALNGNRKIPKDGAFQGDSYFNSMVHTNELKLIKTIMPAPQKYLSESKGDNMEKKLILDQPDKITTKGKVEFVEIEKTPKKKKKINEVHSDEPQEEILINEDPVGSMEVINE